MNRLRWHFAIFKQHLGWAGLLGLVALLYGVFNYFTIVVPSQNALIVTQQALFNAKSEQFFNTSQVVVIKQGPMEKLQNFEDNFPSAASINHTWGQLSKLLEKSGLIVERSFYESSSDKHAGLLRYHFNVPIKAAYPQIRNFLAEVMQTIPNVALENFSLKRESVDSPILDANISLVIYVRAQ